MNLLTKKSFFARSILITLVITLAGYNLLLFIKRQENQPLTTDLRIDRSVIDVDTVSLNIPVSGSFVVKNPSPDERITIDTIDAGCTCTEATINKKSLSPGDSAVVSYRYRNDVTGHFQRMLVIRSNAVNSPAFVKIKGFSLAKN
jgi:Protein of unknown function (DUF1573)